MLRLVVCCGGGMSSSILSAQFQSTIEKRNWETKVSIDYLPLVFLPKHQEKYDLALVCPHSIHTAKNLIKEDKVRIPIYIIPARLYGIMRLEPLVEDAIDILNIYKETGMNPLHFPHEEFLERKRDISYRRWIKHHPYTTEEL